MVPKAMKGLSVLARVTGLTSIRGLRLLLYNGAARRKSRTQGRSGDLLRHPCGKPQQTHSRRDS